jgi:p-aminobenzoyl-glutamate transporter AbgT
MASGAPVKRTNIRRWFTIVSITVVGTILAYFLLIEPLTPLGIQQRHMAEAKAHVPAIQRELAQDRRFRAVQVEVTTAMDGGIELCGCVASEADFADLKRIVEATAPPRPIRWSVNVIPPDVFEEMFP